MVRARPGCLSALGVSHSKSVLYGAFVWARRAPKCRFLARTVAKFAPMRDAINRTGRPILLMCESFLWNVDPEMRELCNLQVRKTTLGQLQPVIAVFPHERTG